MKIFDVIKHPLMTEKSVAAQSTNQYFFAVNPYATKIDIRLAVEKIFRVKVEKVQTLQVPRKFARVGKNRGMRTQWKKAMVTLKQGDRIEFAEGK